MPLVREPSQRTKAWVRWNYGQNSSKTSLASAPTEIIHLGGSRVNTPEPSSYRPSTAQETGRPVTKWFPAPYSPAPEPPTAIARSQTDPSGLVSHTPSSSSSTYSPASLSVRSDKLSSPISSAKSNSSFPKLQSPPPYSSNGSDISTQESLPQLRRTRSAVDVAQRPQFRPQSKDLPLPPLDSPDASDSEVESPAKATHVGQLLNDEARVTQWFALPPLTSPPPTKPLPPVMARKTSPPREKPEEPAPAQPTVVVRPIRISSRHSPQERLWLHRNYRGEATFLKAWGLSIEKEEEREEGMELMKELMDSEEEKLRSKRAQKAKDAGLQIIIEEDKSSFSEPDRPSPRMLEHSLERSIQALRVPSRKSRAALSPADRHLRSESESSVLGAYLDIRMSRMD